MQHGYRPAFCGCAKTRKGTMISLPLWQFRVATRTLTSSSLLLFFQSNHSPTDSDLYSRAPTSMASLKIPICQPPSLRQQPSQEIKPAPALLPVHEQQRSRKRFREWRSTVGKKVGMRLKANLDVAAAVVGKVTEVNKDTFWPIVKAAGEKVVVLDMYTQWCGPCKVMAQIQRVV